jgi:anaerobic ribonucleoside-triphosphate reductase activating protein
MLRINRVLAPITVLGAGRRVGVWVQGCGLACSGCASVDTWDPTQGALNDPASLAAILADQVLVQDLDGLTITGGEPLDQPDQLAELVRILKAHLDSRALAADFDVLLFSGYAVKAARKRAGELWSLLDAVVCGPYRRNSPSELPLLASSNQELLTLTDLGQRRYPLKDQAARMQVVSDGDTLTMVGLPRPGELDLLASRLAARGVELAGLSWQS